MNDRTPILVRPLLQLVALYACLLLSACDFVTTSAPPGWPSIEVLRAFDTSSIESNPAIRVVEAVTFAAGISQICGDFPVPPELRVPDDELEPQEEELGRLSHNVVLAEVERRYPGDPRNPRAAENIWRIIGERSALRGVEAARTRGCGAVRPEYLAGYRAMQAWRSAAHPGVSP